MKVALWQSILYSNWFDALNINQCFLNAFLRPRPISGMDEFAFYMLVYYVSNQSIVLFTSFNNKMHSPY